MEKYLVFNNFSRAVRDMENFLEDNGVPYVTVYKSSDSQARVFPPDNGLPYNEKGFSRLKRIITAEKSAN